MIDEFTNTFKRHNSSFNFSWLKLDNRIGKDVDNNFFNTDVDKTLPLNLNLLNLKFIYTVLIQKNNNREIK